MQTCGKVSGRGIRATPAQQNRLAPFVTRDKALGQDDFAAIGEPLLQRRVCDDFTLRGQVVLRSLATTLINTCQQITSVVPLDRNANAPQILSTEAGRHQFAQRHDANAHADTDLAYKANAGNQLLELVQCLVEQARPVNLQGFSKRVVLCPDLVEPVRLFSGRGRTQNRLQAVRDAG